MDALVVNCRILSDKLLGDLAGNIIDRICRNDINSCKRVWSWAGIGPLPGEFGSSVRAWVSGRTTSDDSRESAASARIGLNNLMTAWKM